MAIGSNHIQINWLRNSRLYKWAMRIAQRIWGR
jgi:hypothetical protein